MSDRRARRGDDDDDLAQQREKRRLEREERRKQREAESNQAESERQKAREERRRKRESGEDTSSARSRRQEEEAKKAKEEEERRKKQQEEEERRKKQQQEEAERKRREEEQQRQQEEEEKEEVRPPVKPASDKTDGPKTAFDKIDDDRKRRIIDSLIDRLYELAEERDAKNKPAEKTATSGASTADISSLDLKVRSLRTRLRNAENATESLNKQQKDLEMKIKMNHQEVERLRNEYSAAESEYNEAIKNGAVLPEGPKRGRGTGAGKGAGFFDVVKKAQSSLWEDKFRAFKEKQRETASSQPTWVNNLRKSDNIIGTTIMKREDPEKKKEKAAWQNQPKLHKAVIDPRAKKEAEPAGAKKPAWSGVALKKAEKK